MSGLVGVTKRQPSLLREAAANVAAFIRARAEDVVFVDNATAGANAVLKSFAFESGDEILLTDHNYGAIANAAAFVARERGARVRTVTVPYPGFDSNRLVEAVARAIGPRTRLAVFDHIAAESALILPVADLAARCRDRGVAVLIDGAHAPGTLDLDVPAIGADWYVCNLHKWAHAPRSCGILWAHPSRQQGLHPPVISWGLDQGFTAEFDWVGTRDPSPWLAAPAGIAFLSELGFDQVRRYSHDLAWRAAQELTGRWGTSLPCAEAHVGSMATVPLPASLGTTMAHAARLRDALLEENRIEVQVHARHDSLWARVSVQVYNDWDDIERLRDSIADRAHANTAA
jgi:isopenicillin-N epimerase